MRKVGGHKWLALGMAVMMFMLIGAGNVQSDDGETKYEMPESTYEDTIEESETTEESVDDETQGEETTSDSENINSEEAEEIEETEEKNEAEEEYEDTSIESSEMFSEPEEEQRVNRQVSSVQYQAHVQSYNWQQWMADGAVSGTEGLAKRMEAIRIQVSAENLSGGVEYRSHVQSYGWMDWVSDGAVSGTTGIAKRLEAVQIRLTGELAEHYDVYYRVHIQTYGWLSWAKNGEAAGSAGLEKRVEAIQITLVEKGGEAPGDLTRPYIENLKVSYRSHIQTNGWLKYVSNGETSGTTGQAKRIEAVQIKLENHSLIQGDIEYQVHCQSFDWMDWVSGNEIAGTTALKKRMEAIKIRLTGEMSEKYDVYYRVHCQTFGWTGWACNGEPAGSEAYGKRMEAIEIRLVEKGGKAPGSTDDTFYKPQLWGIDVSSWQGAINWAKVKADGADFAMLRITQKNTTGTSNRLMKDRHFDDNARGALANGIQIGGYVYIYSSTPEEAREDAQYALSLIKGYNFTYPIAFDLEEEEHMTTAAKLNNMAMAREFCKVFQEAGYKTCVYGSPSKLTEAFDYHEIAASYDIWLARYRWSYDVMDFNDESMRQTVYETGYEGGNWTGLTNVQIWQFTSTGRVDGISGDVDLDLCYKVY